jgi:uncharacterized protein (TIGR02246 family)
MPLRFVGQVPIVVLMFSLTITVSEAQANRSEADVRSMVGRLVDAINSRDAVAASKLYAADADRIEATGGTHAKGRQAIAAMYRALFDQVPSETRYRFDYEVRFIRPDVALLDGTATGTSGATAPFTLVVTKEVDGWMVAAGRQGRVVQP